MPDPIPSEPQRIDYDREYVERFERAKTAAEARGLKYEHPQRVGIGWKIHLNVVPNPTDALTKDIATFAHAKRYVFKIGEGGEMGKGMTIYIGDRDTTEDFAQELTDAFGDRLPPPTGDILIEDTPINGTVWARFENLRDYERQQGVLSTKYIQYGATGLPYLALDTNKSDFGAPEERLSPEQMVEHSRAELTQDYGAFFTGTRGIQD